MRALLSRIAKLLAITFVVGYLPLLAYSYRFEPEVDEIDIFPVQNRGDQSSLGLYGYRLQKSDKPKIFLLGASGVMHGMRPKDFQEVFPGYQAANLAVSGTNISGITQMLDAAKNTISPELQKRSKFIVGIFFGTFIENRVRYGRFRPDKRDVPDCFEGIVKYGFYEFDGGTVRPRFPTWAWTIGAHLRRPFGVFADNLTLNQDYYKAIHKSVFEVFPAARASTRESLEDLLGPRRKAVEFWPEFMDRPDGTLSDEQFHELTKLSDYARATGLEIVVVDLPIASWHSKASPLYRDYQARKQRFYEQAFSNGGLRYIDMQDLGDEESFSDSVHVRAEYTKRWAETIHSRWPSSDSAVPRRQ